MELESSRASAVSYFYGRISRDEAVTFLKNNGCKEGLYLLRKNVSTARNYELSICHNKRIHHYSIEKQRDGQVMIPGGRRFPGPVELITHHSEYLDELITKPKIPCARPNGVAPMAWPEVTMLELEQILVEEAVDKKKLKGSKLENAPGSQRQRLVTTVAKNLHKEQRWFHRSITKEQAERAMNASGHQDGKFLIRKKKKGSFALSLSYVITRHKTLMFDQLRIEAGLRFDNLMNMVAHYYNKSDGLVCKLTTPVERPGYVKKKRILCCDATDETMQVRDSPPRTDEMFRLNRRNIFLTTELAAGQYGPIMLGEYEHNSEIFPVAVKTLKQSDMEAGEEEMMEEACLMAQLNNPYIVRMIGVCRSESFMLVLELAPLGPINKYLRKFPMTTVQNITELMQQVAEGMAYLESRDFVHRDLGARNVLLANEHLAKISDFGMSEKALGIDVDDDEEYYTDEKTVTLPLKWAAPECIYFSKFDSKSDVWSYGVTLWETMTYGAKPYKDMKAAEVVEMIDNELRLDKPEKCPQRIYELMLNCWQRKSDDRPTFQQIVTQMTSFL